MRGIKFTNIRQPMLKLKTHSGFHDLFRFWYVLQYKYGSILWLEDGNLYLRLRSFFRFVIKREIYRLGIFSLAHAPVHVTDFRVLNVHVGELSSARIWQHTLCATLSANLCMSPFPYYMRNGTIDYTSTWVWTLKASFNSIQWSCWWPMLIKK
jgi:hypothetical protein